MDRLRNLLPKTGVGKIIALILLGVMLVVLTVVIWRVFSAKGLYKQELEELGFSCEMTSFVREAKAAEFLQDEQVFVERIAASIIAENELLNCQHSEEKYNFWVAATSDTETLLGLVAEYYVCLPDLVSDISAEETALNLRFMRQSLGEHFVAIGGYVYGFEKKEQRVVFATLLDLEEISYAEHGLAGFTCRD